MSIDKPPAPDFEDLFDGAPCALVVTDEDGTILRSNRIFSLWMGISQEALTQRRFQDLLTMGGKNLPSDPLGATNAHAGLRCRGKT